jgi:hypothetical protein
MPCHDPRDHVANSSLQARNDQLTRVSCDMRTILRKHSLEHEVCSETIRWIHEHDRFDAERIAGEQRRNEREAMKQNALDKLTMDERRMLGL